MRDPEMIDQMRNVLRLSKGDTFILFDGNFHEAFVEIEEMTKGRVVVKIVKILKNEAESKNLSSINLYCAILKKENFEWAVQKATEAGVASIHPIITARTVKTGLKRERLERIMKEASEQAGRGIVPKLGEILTFKKAVDSREKDATHVLLDPEGEFPRKFPSFSKANIFVGPEGGFHPHEIEIAKKEGFFIIQLGPFPLRSESAAFIGCWLLKNWHNITSDLKSDSYIRP